MKSKPKFIDMLVCDDIRREDSGKLLFVGVYMDKIIVRAVPLVLPQIVIFSKWEGGKEVISNFDFTLYTPDNKVMANIKGKVPPPPNAVEKNKIKHIIQLKIAPFKVETTGEYKIKFKLNNSYEYDVGSIVVELAGQAIDTVQ